MFTQKSENYLAYEIVGCAIEVQKQLGPGLLESVYEKCLKYELELKGFIVDNQKNINVCYKNLTFNSELRIDLLVNDIIVVEIKSVENITAVHKAQLLTYLKVLNKPKGLLLNFNSINITKSLVSLVTEEFAKLPAE